MSNFVYDSLYEPSHQVKNRSRRVPNSRVETSYFECQLKPEFGGAEGTGFTTKQACEDAQVCIGPGKAYGYVCGDTVVTKKLGGEGFATAADTKCYGCAVSGVDGTKKLVYTEDAGQVTGSCDYQPGGETNPLLFSTVETCQADNGAKCGWTFACKS